MRIQIEVNKQAETVQKEENFDEPKGKKDRSIEEESLGSSEEKDQHRSTQDKKIEDGSKE